jgi:hypothetical protein
VIWSLAPARALLELQLELCVLGKISQCLSDYFFFCQNSGVNARLSYPGLTRIMRERKEKALSI